jgi:septal ring factor EnvC (AmiA/AmiB activator)
LRDALSALKTEATANLERWQQLVTSEQQSSAHLAGQVQELGARVLAGERRNDLRRVYAAAERSAAPAPRFVDRLR